MKLSATLIFINILTRFKDNPRPGYTLNKGIATASR